MPLNSYGHLFRVTTWGESHGPALGATVDGCPPGVALEPAMLQHWLDRRRPGTSRYTTQRREADAVEILSGVFEGRTTGHPIQLMIRNTDQRPKDYGDIIDKFRPGHADYTYWLKYGIRDHRGGGSKVVPGTPVGGPLKNNPPGSGSSGNPETTLWNPSTHSQRTVSPGRIVRSISMFSWPSYPNEMPSSVTS